jgi:YD repeat-containing protein
LVFTLRRQWARAGHGRDDLLGRPIHNVDEWANPTTFTYDLAGRKLRATGKT